MSREVRQDMQIWQAFLRDFNGSVVWRSQPRSNAELGLFTDSAGSVGFGAILGSAWCAQRWPVQWEEWGLLANIGFLELFPIWVALAVWPEQFRNQSVVFWSDNMSVVECINQQAARCGMILRVLKEIVLLCLRLNVSFRAKHVPGVLNNAADALSRFKMQEFRQHHPGAADHPAPFPVHLWQIGAPAYQTSW